MTKQEIKIINKALDELEKKIVESIDYHTSTFKELMGEYLEDLRDITNVLEEGNVIE